MPSMSTHLLFYDILFILCSGSKQKLGVDKAGLTVTSRKAGILTVYWRSENCYKVGYAFRYGAN